MKDELGGQIMKWFVRLRVKTYSYLIDDGSEDKKAKDPRRCVIGKLKFEDYKNCLAGTQFQNRINHVENLKLM